LQENVTEGGVGGVRIGLVDDPLAACRNGLIESAEIGKNIKNTRAEGERSRIDGKPSPGGIESLLVLIRPRIVVCQCTVNLGVAGTEGKGFL
jgi:hypothetical protein